MKINFLLLCLLFAYFPAFNQTWAPDGATWHYSLSYFGSQDLNYNTMIVQGDSMINGVNCSRVIRLHQTCNMQPSKEFMYMDSTDRVFYWDALSNDFQLLYDFGKQTGQTYDIVSKRLSFSPPYDTIHLRIDSVFSMVLNGQARQVQVIQEIGRPSYLPFRYEVIEGIGSNWQMFPWDNGICDYQYDTELRCYEDSTFGQYNFWGGSICTAILLSIPEPTPTELQFSLYPNPSHDKIGWEDIGAANQSLSSSEYEVKIMDSDGRLVLQQNTTTNFIGTSDLVDGVYFIEVIDRNGLSQKGKFVVLHR